MAEARSRGRTLGPMPHYVDPAGFAEWEATVPTSIRRDPIWRTPAYRYGLWLGDLARQDAKVLYKDRDSRNNAKQLVRAVEGISSNLSEGYGCSTGPERARYYGYAVTSTRESRDWYYKGRDILGVDVMAQRHEVLERIIRILSVAIPEERSAPPRKPRRMRRDRRQRDSPDASGGSSS